MSYRIGRSEQGVLTFEPYKSHLLPLWRFKTPEIARESAQKIEGEFLRFEEGRDFVGCDMARKFLQMGMTRSTRYANRAGGRKYDSSGSLLPKSTDHPGAAAKLESARIFREAWERVKAREGYHELRKEWEAEKKRWEREGKPGLQAQEDGEGDAVSEEEASGQEEENKSSMPGSRRSSVRRRGGSEVKSEPSSKASASALKNDTGTSPDVLKSQDQDQPKGVKRRRVDKSAGIKAEEAKEEET
ncbi:hypothetical protein B0A53_03136 [Rhodotorula sp. CCFEE 5036]|nr:hypothetical protein B0A53_03136 [Rhodotorula sp. CCFEE 5036]